jgi:uncharacterized delta-60 repeat protein
VSTIRSTVALSLVLTILGAATAAAAPGDLDPTFGQYGKYLSPTKDSTSATEAVIRPDGTIIVGGYSSKGTTIFGFTAAGAPNPAFGQGGRVVLPSGFSSASVALQGDRIVAAASDGKGQLVIYRLDPNGALDQTFGVGGVAETGLSSGRPAPRVAIAPDQKIVVTSTSAPIPGLAVARLLADGQGFDPSFAGGVVYIDSVSGGAAQGIVAGPADEVTVLTSTPFARVLRYRGDGSLDPAFGAGGVADVRPDGVNAYLFDLALRADGSLVAVGRLATPDTGVVVSLTPAGALDASFATDGAADLESASLTGVAFDAAGRILAAGSGSTPSSVRMLLARLLPDGSLDQTFGTAGRVSAGFGRATTVGRSLAILPDGRILVATNRITGFRSDFLVLGLMRFVVADGPRDPDADGVLGRRDRCPDLGGKARDHGCPVVEREIELTAHGHGVSGEVDTIRQCIGIDRVSIFGAMAGRDRRLGHVNMNKGGGFHARFGPRFEGHIYTRLNARVNPAVGLCSAARSNTVDVP